MKFTEECARAIKQAQTYAMRKGGLLGTEHMLAGIASSQCKGGKILARFVDADALIAALLPQEDEPTSNVRITPRVDRALRSSEIYGKMNGVGAIDSVTLLTCLLEDGGSYACRALASIGVDVEELRARLMAQTMFDRHEEDDGDDDEDDDEDEGEAFGSGLNIDKTNTGAKKTNINAKLPKELQDLGEDLTEKARQGKLDPIIGRSKEIERIIEILCRRTKNNPVLIGEPGVGKSAIVEGLAQAIVNGDVPEMLRGKTVFSLNITSVLSGTKYRGEFEERLKKAIDAILSRGDIIVFIDEIHMIVGAGSTSENGVDAANILKPMLARGEMQTIGATTLDEYRKFIEKDSALERRFQQIIVDPPSVEDTITILKGIRSKYEEHHHVTITDEAIEAAAKMSDRYISDRFLPDKAIDLIDEAASKKRISNFVLPDDVKKMEDEVNRLKVEQVSFAKHELYEEAQEAKVKAAELQRRIDEQKKAWHQKHSDTKLEVGVDDIAAVVSAWTKIPVVKLTESEAQRLLHLEETLHKRVVGQDEAVSAVAKAVRRARAGVQDSKRPIGSFIFLGPTGVGKTELSKALAEAMFGDENMLIRIGYVRVHGQDQRVQIDRFRARLRRLRRGRTIDRKGAPQTLFRRAFRRDRKGSPRRVQHLAPNPRRRQIDRFARQDGQLQEHHRHHDVQHRRERDQGKGKAGLRFERRRDRLRQHEGEADGGAQKGDAPRVHQPYRRRDNLPSAAQRGHEFHRHDDGRRACKEA